MKNNRRIKIFAAVLAIMVVAGLIVAPLCIPLPTGLYTEKQLSDPDSRFITVDGISVHYKQYGSGYPYYILLHGTLATTSTWREVAIPLSRIGTVIAYDRPAFGLTSRPMEREFVQSSPYGYQAQVHLLLRLLDALNIRQAVLIGNSMGGAIACMAAEQYPDRFGAAILVDPVQNRHALPGPVRWLAEIPQVRQIGLWYIHNNVERFGRYLYPLSWHDPSIISKAIFDEYTKIFKIKNFDQGIWELLLAARPFEKLLHPENIKIPTLVIAGDDDRVAGIKQTSTGTQDLVRLTRKIPHAKLTIIPNCGHVPQEECPVVFVEAIARFMTEQGLK